MSEWLRNTLNPCQPVVFLNTDKVWSRTVCTCVRIPLSLVWMPWLVCMPWLVRTYTVHRSNAQLLMCCGKLAGRGRI